jgi:hypothetical protein
MGLRPEMRRTTLNNEAEGQSAGPDRRLSILAWGGRERTVMEVLNGGSCAAAS